MFHRHIQAEVNLKIVPSLVCIEEILKLVQQTFLDHFASTVDRVIFAWIGLIDPHEIIPEAKPAHLTLMLRTWFSLSWLVDDTGALD